ncbi:unnamed protein product [Lymnaea stagnalis]|uniref:Tyrosine-protein phosphatase domain-containing protein n=1 Tax=Lymnaea stagnalis TaxID=6523 RepID=A0AAV2HVC7_LYMST
MYFPIFRSGTKYSGLACVLSILLDRMEEESCVIVPLVVGSIKSVEPEIIPNLEQYRCLYQVIQKYIERYHSWL